MQTAQEAFTMWAAKMAVLVGCIGVPLVVGIVAAIALLAKGSTDKNEK